MRTLLFLVWFSSCLMKYNLASPAADWDDAPHYRDPVFRKDYTLDAQRLGWFKLHRVPDTWDKARERCQLEGVPLGEMPVNWTNGIPDSDNDKRCVTLSTKGTIHNVNCLTLSLPYICYKENNFTPLTECGTIDTEYTFNSTLNTCYKLHIKKRNWHDAFKTCSAEGGHLVVINSDEEFKAVVQLFKKDPIANEDSKYKVSVGVVRLKSSGQWATIHGEELEKSGFSLWKSFQYDNTHYNCGGLTRSGFTNLFCEVELTAFVCEKKPDSLITPYQLLKITIPTIDI